MLTHHLAPIRNELNPGEELLWSDSPIQGIRFQNAYLFMIAFGLISASMALLNMMNTVGPSLGARLFFGIPITFMGCYMVCAGPLIDAYVRSKTTYGLTNERVIIIADLLIRDVTSIRLCTVNEITLHLESREVGSIAFGPLPENANTAHDMSWLSTPKRRPPQIKMIPDAKRVYDMIGEIQDRG